MIVEGIEVVFHEWHCMLDVTKYHRGGVAIQVLDREDGSPLCRATIHVPDVALGQHEVIIKDYAENGGILAAFVEAGVVVDTGRTVPLGWVHGTICKIVHPHLVCVLDE